MKDGALCEREEKLKEEEERAERRRQELQEERELLHRNKDHYQRELERLKEAQMKLERDKEALRKDTEKLEAQRKEQVSSMCSTIPDGAHLFMHVNDHLQKILISFIPPFVRL